MQLISTYLYPNKIDVFTNPVSELTKERYRQVYNRNLKIYRGVDNRIDIQVKNSDQKPLNIAGNTYVFTLISRETQELIFEKTCSLRSANVGRLYAEISALESQTIESGNYQFSIIEEERTAIDEDEYQVTKRTPMYLDDQYGSIGNLEVYGNLYGEPLPSKVYKEFSTDVPEQYTEPYTYYSSIIDARPKTTTGSSVHTFQFYMTDYSGEVVIQGSLSDGGNPHVWSDIESFDIIGSNLKYANVTGKFNYFRIKHIPNKVTAIAEFVVAQTILNSYTVSIRSAGKNYSIGDTITISGGRLGGETPDNNLIITVTSVDQNGVITGISWTGVSYAGVRTFVLKGDTTPIGTIDKILYR